MAESAHEIRFDWSLFRLSTVDNIGLGNFGHLSQLLLGPSLTPNDFSLFATSVPLVLTRASNIPNCDICSFSFRSFSCNSSFLVFIAFSFSKTVRSKSRENFIVITYLSCGIYCCLTAINVTYVSIIKSTGLFCRCIMLCMNQILLVRGAGDKLSLELSRRKSLLS